MLLSSVLWGYFRWLPIQAAGGEDSLAPVPIEKQVPKNELVGPDLESTRSVSYGEGRGLVEADSSEDSASVSKDFVTIQGERFRVTFDGEIRSILFPSGQVYSSGRWADGRRIGPQEVWYKDGARHAIESYNDGTRDGFCQYFHRNGVKSSEGAYVNGFMEGLWTSWWPNGMIESVGSYTHNQEEGLWEYYLWDGSLDQDRSGVYHNGKLTAD